MPGRRRSALLVVGVPRDNRPPPRRSARPSLERRRSRLWSGPHHAHPRFDQLAGGCRPTQDIGWQRPIALDPITVGVLRVHRKRMRGRRILVGAGFVDQDFVFCEPDGSPLHPERVYQAFKRRVGKHAFPYLSPHGLRHTWATIALANGVHPRVVQERLGHACTSRSRCRAYSACAADDARRRRCAGSEPSTSGAPAIRTSSELPRVASIRRDRIGISSTMCPWRLVGGEALLGPARAVAVAARDRRCAVVP